jgi:hypothetical protein
LGSIVWSFFRPVWAWAPLCLLALFFLSVLLSLRLKKWHYVPELSTGANEMLQKFGHYYSMPFAGRDFSSACSVVQFAAVAVAAVGAFKGLWWGIPLALLFWFVLGAAAMSYNPTNFIQNQPTLLAAHEEVIEWLTSKPHQ